MTVNRNLKFEQLRHLKNLNRKRIIIDSQGRRSLYLDIYKAEIEKQKSTEEFKNYEIRKKLLQVLDKSNKNANNEQKILNTLEFLNSTINLIINEYNKLKEKKKINDLDLVDFAKNYAIHTKIIMKFDASTPLNPDLGYTEPLFKVLEKELNKLNKNLIKFFSLDTSVILSM